MRGVGLLLALTLSADAVDGGSDRSSPIYAGCVDASDAGEVIIDDAGVYLFPRERALRNACTMAACESHRRDLETDRNARLSPGSQVAIVAGALAIGIGTGIALGYAIKR